MYFGGLSARTYLPENRIYFNGVFLIKRALKKYRIHFRQLRIESF